MMEYWNNGILEDWKPSNHPPLRERWGEGTYLATVFSENLRSFEFEKEER
jgi:hypothetical protein